MECVLFKVFFCEAGASEGFFFCSEDFLMRGVVWKVIFVICSPLVLMRGVGLNVFVFCSCFLLQRVCLSGGWFGWFLFLICGPISSCWSLDLACRECPKHP